MRDYYISLGKNCYSIGNLNYIPQEITYFFRNKNDLLRRFFVGKKSSI